MIKAIVILSLIIVFLVFVIVFMIYIYRNKMSKTSREMAYVSEELRRSGEIIGSLESQIVELHGKVQGAVNVPKNITISGAADAFDRLNSGG